MSIGISKRVLNGERTIRLGITVKRKILDLSPNLRHFAEKLICAATSQTGANLLLTDILKYRQETARRNDFAQPCRCVRILPIDVWPLGVNNYYKETTEPIARAVVERP